MTDTTTQVKERPILFSTPMVQAIDAGRKTVTRRVVKKQPIIDYDGLRFPWATFFNSGNVFTWDEDGIGGENWNATDYPNENKFEQALLRTQYKSPCPYGQPGDILWVRETWRYSDDTVNPYDYKAIFEKEYNAEYLKRTKGSWKPSIFMPKDACRIKLKILSIRVERLHDITEEDAIKEGVQENICENPSECISSFCKIGCAGRGEYYRYPVDFDGLPCYSAIESFQTLWESINGDESWDVNPWVWRIEFKKL